MTGNPILAGSPPWRGWLLIAAALWMSFAPAVVAAMPAANPYREDSSAHRPGTSPGLHIYLYANGSPLSYSDPSGHFTLAEAMVVVALVGVTNAIAAPAIPVAIMYRVGLGIEAEDPDAYSERGLNVGVDPGHTFAYLRDNSKKITIVHSFGPGERIGTHKTEFESGKLPGDPHWRLMGNAFVKEWPISKDAYESVFAAMSAFKADPPTYTETRHCTSTAVEMVRLAGISDIPEGISKIYYDRYGITSIRADGVNPYALREQMKLTTKVSTDFFPSP